MSKRLVTLGELAAVGCAGVLGASLRVLLGGLFPDAELALTTLCINVAGCAMLAWLNAWAAVRSVPDLLRSALGTGFCGAFTTFSTIALFMVPMSPWGYVTYLTLTLALCLAAVWGTTRLVNAYDKSHASRSRI